MPERVTGLFWESCLPCSSCGSSYCFPEVSNSLQTAFCSAQGDSTGHLSWGSRGCGDSEGWTHIRKHRQAPVCPYMTPLALGPHCI